jgi:hypothetical protein
MSTLWIALQWRLLRIGIQVKFMSTKKRSAASELTNKTGLDLKVCVDSVVQGCLVASRV